MKIDCDMNKFHNYAFPMSTVLVTCNDKGGKTNVLTIAWHTTISKKPALYGISLAKQRYSYKLIKESKEFVINYATFDLVEKIHFCGTNSGRNVDKIKESNFTLIPSKKLKTPLIKECYAHLECKLNETYTIGDHILIVGKVVNVSKDEGSFIDDTLDNSKNQTCCYLGNNTYSKVDKIVRKF